MAGWLDAGMAVCQDGRMDVWATGRLGDWMIDWMDACMHACMHGWITANELYGLQGKKVMGIVNC